MSDRPEKFPCAICGAPTRNINKEYELPICSDRCNKELIEGEIHEPKN